METQTRFDLDAAITNWQQELATQADLTPIVRRELETHLRDTLAELHTRGLNNEEAFWLARRRLGRAQLLGDEFAKADPAVAWRDRVFWMVAALLVITLWGSSLNLVFGFAFNFLIKWKPMASESYSLYSTGFQILFKWGPILVACVLLAKGRFSFKGERWNRLLRSRTGLSVLAGVWILVNSWALIWMIGGELSRFQYNWHHILTNLLQSLVWPCFLTGLLAWLTPKMSRQRTT